MSSTSQSSEIPQSNWSLATLAPYFLLRVMHRHIEIIDAGRNMIHYSEKGNLFPVYGGCPCGQTRYILTLPPFLVHACHCLACQRQTGSSHALNAIIETKALRVHSSPMREESGVSGQLPAFLEATNSTLPTLHEPGDEILSSTCIPTASGNGQTLVCCSKCRGVLWNHYAGAGPHTAYLRVGTLDEPWEIDPDVHIYTKTKRNYMALADGKPAFGEYYNDRRAFYRDDVLERVRLLDNEVEAYKKTMRQAS